MSTEADLSAAATRLDYAETLLCGAARSPAWPRLTAWLIRLALEYTLAALWTTRCPELVDARFRSQLLALGVLVDADTAQRATHLWTALSRAGHHHYYELEPSAVELRAWLDEARRLSAVLSSLAVSESHR